MKFKQLGQQGFSLVQVMVALGIAGVLSVVIMKNMEMQTKATKKATLDQNLLDIRRQITDVISRSEPCNSTFAHRISRGDDLDAILMKPDNTRSDIFAQVGSEFKQSKIKVKRIHLMTVAEETTYNNQKVFDLDDKGIGTALLEITFERMGNEGTNKTFYGSKDAKIYVPILAKFTTLEPINGSSDAVCDTFSLSKVAQRQAEMDAEMRAQGPSTPPAPAVVPSDYLVRRLSYNCEETTAPNLNGYFGEAEYAHVNFEISQCGDDVNKD